MNSWQVLGIEPTSDEALIRRAYARLLKKHRPDSDPQGYQRLREAFEEAKNSLSSLQWADSSDEANDVQPSTETQFEVKTDHAISPPAAEQRWLTPVYTQEEIETLAFGLVEHGAQQLAALDALYQRVMREGNLLQQQQFHHQLAAALAQQPGLAEWLVDRVSDLLAWELDQYSSSYRVPEELQNALYAQVHATERERAWAQVNIESTHGSRYTRIVWDLLRSERTSVPFWVRLVPGLITRMAHQVNMLWATFPELVQRLNPVMLEFISTSRCALSWQGIFLLAFWSVILHLTLSLSSTTGLIALGIVIFYLYLNDLIILGLARRKGMSGLFLLLECGLSLVMLSALFAGVLFITISQMPARGEGFQGLTPLFMVLIEFLILWSVWPKNVPGIRRPGVAVARLFTSPWRLLVTLDFSVMAFPLVAFYGAFCYLLLNELVKAATGFY